jgi:hypothetical protein
VPYVAVKAYKVVVGWIKDETLTEEMGILAEGAGCFAEEGEEKKAWCDFTQVKKILRVRSALFVKRLGFFSCLSKN